MWGTAVWILLLCVRPARAESGDSAYEDDEKDIEEMISFECLFHRDLSELVCFLNNTSDKDSRPIDFKACLYDDDDDKPPECRKMEKMTNNYRLDNILSGLYNICMTHSGIPICKQYKTDHIALGKPLLDLSVSYDEASDGHKIIVISPHGNGDVLQNQGIYELRLRKVNEDWPECDDDTVAKKMCIITTADEVLIPSTKLETNTQYEAKVRARPAHDFNETATRWTKPAFFKTNKRRFEENEPIHFECFSGFHVDLSELFCVLNSTSDTDSRNITFTACSHYYYDDDDEEPDCKEMDKKPDSYRLKIIVSAEYNVCMSISGIPRCKKYDTKLIVLGKTPLNLTVTYDEAGKQYKIAFISPYGEGDMLQNRVRYEILLRKVTKEWPGCSADMIAKKMCISTTDDEVLIPETMLEPDTKYEAKVRAKPTNHFDGTASPWTSTAIFKTNKRCTVTSEEPGQSSTECRDSSHTHIISTVDDEGKEILIIILSIGVFILLILIIFIIIFWKSRIKPRLWPEIPDHKSTLEKLCQKNVKHHNITSFDPYNFEEKFINKVDDIQAKELEGDGSLYPGEAEEQPVPELDDNTPKRANEMVIGEASALTNGNARVFSCESLDTQRSNPSNQMTVTDGQRSMALYNANVFLQSFQNGTDKSKPPESIIKDVSPSMMDNPHVQPNATKQTSNGFKAVPWEEAYIDMSAFKTPISVSK
uniref:Uncharacterized protein n=1 Tax=Leptobrachium leishanense TaxID=445787 RepID=A0A8C5LPZ0_9ANUR